MTPKRVLLLLCNGTELYEAAAFHDVCGWSGVYGSEAVEIVTAAPRKEVVCTFGLRLVADRLVTEVDPAEFDALAVPGGFERFGFQSDASLPEVLALIAAFADLGKPVASICVGALPVARSGALAGRRATTYHLMGGHSRRELAELGAHVVDEPLVRDGTFVTSTSPATAVAVALQLLEELTGPENAATIRALMGFGGEGAGRTG